jgi:hypothetical protein
MLTTLPFNSYFDLDPWVGQRSATFRFHRVNGLTGENLGDITPLRGANLSHDTSRTIKRTLSMNLGVTDTAAIDPLVDRIDVFMDLADGTEWPLGRYMFTDDSAQRFTSGRLANVSLNDEMFLVDQEITAGFNASNLGVTSAIQALLEDLPVSLTVAASPFLASQSWGQGTDRGSIVEALAVTGDYFSPWFGNDKIMHFIRTFNPAMVVPQFDYDAGNQVVRTGIVESSNLLTAPNRFIVISNTNAGESPIVGVADVPQNAPHSFANRGFYITKTVNLQLNDSTQASVVAEGLATRQTVFETTSLTTPPDPRHDSYDVINWMGSLWLELGWTMQLTEGGAMNHVLRKAYTP